jgi:hypothetical protein
MFTPQVQGHFTKALEERLKRWREEKNVAARLTTPPDLKWWYYNEFGTATKNERSPGQEYTITPKGNGQLIFPQDGELRHALQVDHPGVRASRSVTKVMPDIRELFRNWAKQALRNGGADNPKVVTDAVSDTAHKAKELIVESMSSNIPGLREMDPAYGRLGGQHASEVFNDEAKVEIVRSE